MVVMEWLAHVLGLDTQQSPYYNFWSGVGPVLLGQLPILTALIVSYRHKICYYPHCYRLGHLDPLHHHPACKVHHSKADELRVTS
jgi:hypothetical protein